METKKLTRSPICVVAGHVDHGKSSILDNIRETSIVEGEAGAITQAIGASLIPIETIKKKCWSLIKDFEFKMKIPGILFIDTPGHAAFTNLRKRGGNLADIAILVVDLNEGFKPQTIEALEILRAYKTPFIVAANKLDLLTGYQQKEGMLLSNISQQFDGVKTALDQKIYELVGKFAEFGFQSERFDRVEDSTKQILIVPCSAKTGEGIPELLMTLTGLTQRYLNNAIQCDIDGPAKGTILEVKEVKGTGTVIDSVIYDGNLKVNDKIVVGSIPMPFVTKIRAIFEPKTLNEIRDKKSSFASVKQCVASCAVRIVAPNLDNAIGGMPIRSIEENEDKKRENTGEGKKKGREEEVIEKVKAEIDEVLIHTDKDGVVVKADSLGSLEAIVQLLREKKINIKKAAIGHITKKDIAEAESSFEKDPMDAVVLGFSVDDVSGINKDSVKVIKHDVVYQLIDDFEKWQKEIHKKLDENQLEAVGRPFKIELLKGYVFRQNNPAVCGVEVLGGKLRTGAALMKDGKNIDSVKAIQLESKSINEVEKGKQVAVSFPHLTVGRQINEGDIIYSFINEESFRKLRELKNKLTSEEIEILKEIALIMRVNNPLWAL